MKKLSPSWTIRCSHGANGRSTATDINRGLWVGKDGVGHAGPVGVDGSVTLGRIRVRGAKLIFEQDFLTVYHFWFYLEKKQLLVIAKD